MFSNGTTCRASHQEAQGFEALGHTALRIQAPGSPLLRLNAPASSKKHMMETSTCLFMAQSAEVLPYSYENWCCYLKPPTKFGESSFPIFGKNSFRTFSRKIRRGLGPEVYRLSEQAPTPKALFFWPQMGTPAGNRGQDQRQLNPPHPAKESPSTLRGLAQPYDHSKPNPKPKKNPQPQSVNLEP